MIKKNFPILIYPGFIIIYYGNKEQVGKEYFEITSKEFGNCLAKTVTILDKSNIYLFFKNNITIDVIAHECIHIKDFLDEKYELRMHMCGEPECYLVQYLFKNIVDELNIKIKMPK